MKVMNLESEEEPVVKKKSKRNLKIALGLAAVILVPTIGSTLAGSITVSSGAIEFGQGVATTVACDTDGITVTPASSFTSAAFRLETISVSGIAAGCDSKYFTIKVLGASDAEQIIGISPATLCKVRFILLTPFTVTPTPACGVVSGADGTSFILTPASHPAASAVLKITLESSSS